MKQNQPQVKKISNGQGSVQNNLQLEQVNEIMDRISSTIKDKINTEAIYYLICIISTITQYFSIYKLNIYIFNFKLFFYSILVMTRRFISRIIKAREASDPLKLRPSTSIFIVIHAAIIFNILYLCIRLWQETYSYTSIIFLAYYHLIYFKYGTSVTEQEHQFGFNHDLNFYFKVIAIKLSEIIYFSCLLPYKCLDEDINYDYFTSMVITAITSINLMLFFAMEIFVNIGLLNKLQAKKLGCWKQISAQEANAQQNFYEWKENQPYKRNVVVSFQDKWYRSIGKTNLSQPGSFKNTIYYLIFHKVKKSRKALIIFSGFLMVFQDFMILKTKNPVTYALTLIQTLIVSGFLIIQNRKLSQNFN
ncbi:hypothetical protein ABPG74_001060 [Tetrahymena malaccensis]